MAGKSAKKTARRLTKGAKKAAKKTARAARTNSSELVDARIKDLGDWRGKTLSLASARSSSRPTPK